MVQKEGKRIPEWSQWVTKSFANARRFVRVSKKPTVSEFKVLLKGHFLGLLLIGVFGYVIKVIHIPINNIIAGLPE